MECVDNIFFMSAVRLLILRILAILQIRRSSLFYRKDILRFVNIFKKTTIVTCSL